MDEQRTPATTKDSFGDHLRREREMRGVTLDEITAATRIGTRFLEAFENEQWDRLPGGVFNRGFVRSIAHYLGLDEENLLAEYMHATSGLTKPSSWVSQTHQHSEPDRRWVPGAVILLVLVILAAGGWLGWRHYRTAKRDRAAAVALNAMMQQAPPQIATPPAAAPAATPVSAGSSPDATDPTTAGAPAAVPAQDPTAPLKLKIEAGKTTSVRVLADGVKLFDGKIQAGSSITFEAIDEFEVSAHDAGTLLLELNGQTLPPIGPPGKSGKITLTFDSLAQATGGNH
jgi:cytoskeleton protein RodZ